MLLTVLAPATINIRQVFICVYFCLYVYIISAMLNLCTTISYFHPKQHFRIVGSKKISPTQYINIFINTCISNFILKDIRN